MQIFISYSRVDKAFATRLADDLIAAGYRIWFDLRSIPHGTNWDMEVQRGLETADVMIVLLSPASVTSENVQDEWNFFITLKRRIIPLMIQPNEVPFRLSRRQRIDFINKDYVTAFEELLAALNEDVTTDDDGRAQPPQTRTLNLSWGERYLPWRGLSPVATGQAVLSQSELQLLAPERLPLSIPITSITDIQLRQLPWDSYLTVHFVDRSANNHEILLMGTERKTRRFTQRETLNLLAAMTGKRFS